MLGIEWAAEVAVESGEACVTEVRQRLVASKRCKNTGDTVVCVYGDGFGVVVQRAGNTFGNTL